MRLKKRPARRVAYLMSWFPAVTETFILYEILELERLGLAVDVFPLFGAKRGVRHPGCERVLRRTHYLRSLSFGMMWAQMVWLFSAPARYLGAWWLALWGNRRSFGFLLRSLVVVPKAARVALELRRRGIEHVHAHWATHPALAALLIQKLTGIPYSFTCHAHDLYMDRTMLREKLEGAGFVVTISDYNRQLLAGLYGAAAAEKIAVVRCGVDPSTFQPVLRVRRRGQPYTLVCVASLREYKGHRYLLDACAELLRRGMHFRCLLIGEGPLRAEIEAHIAAAGLAPYVTLLGAQPQDRVRGWLAEADAMVLPSIVGMDNQQEGIPVALMEGLATGLPVVATRLSGIPELIEHEHTGLLVPEKDAQALAGAIQRLVDNRALASALGRAGRQHVLAGYDRRQNTQRLLHLLLEGRCRQPT